MITFINLGGEEVALNSDHLNFSEETLNDYLRKSGAWFSYYVEKHSKAQFLCSLAEDKHDVIFSKKFRDYKNQGGSDKLAEASARCDDEVAAAQLDIRVIKQKVNLLYGFTRALDKSIQNALNLGYNMRKEMDKLGIGISMTKSLEEALGE